jgi:hypothetical protein
MEPPKLRLPTKIPLMGKNKLFQSEWDSLSIPSIEKEKREIEQTKFAQCSSERSEEEPIGTI